MRLQDDAIIITGSTNGIGAAMARRFVAEGARVLLHGRNREAGERLLAELGASAALHIDDLADPAAAERVVAAALGAFGRIDALVNNAATSARATLDETSADVFDEIIGVNLRAPLLIVRAATGALRASKGAVLNIGSVLAHCGMPKLTAYSVSKGGLMTLTRNLALSLGPSGVRVNQINVGWTLTEREHELQLSEGQSADWLKNVPDVLAPSGTILRPEQIAAAAVYWVGKESRPINGQVFEAEQFPIIGRMPMT